MNKPRLTLVMSHHYAGGAERVMSIMANYWAAKGWQIHLYTLTEADKPPFYPLHEAIKWQGLGLSQPLGNPFLGIIRIYGRLRRLRLAIQQTSPDAVISFNDETNVVTLLAMLGLGVTAIVGERNDPHCHKMNNPWRLLRPLVYRQAAFVVTQTQHALGYFSKAIRSRTKVIPNPVIRPSETEEHYVHGNPSPRSKVILAMGRLEQQKGFDLLIQAFSKVTAKHPDYTLEIWGEGQERTKLENMVADMKLEGRVSLP